MTAGINLGFDPEETFLGATSNDGAGDLHLGQLLCNNRVCPNTLQLPINEPDNGLLAQLAEQIDARTGTNFSEQLAEKAGDLKCFMSHLQHGLQQAGFNTSSDAGLDLKS